MLLLNKTPKSTTELQFNFLFLLFIMRCSRYLGVHDGVRGFIHWSLQFGLTWTLLYWLADTKSNENTDQSSMLAISNSLISIP